MKTVKIICYDITYHRLEELDDVKSFSCDIHEDYVYLKCLNVNGEKSSIKCTSFSMVS